MEGEIGSEDDDVVLGAGGCIVEPCNQDHEPDWLPDVVRRYDLSMPSGG